MTIFINYSDKTKSVSATEQHCLKGVCEDNQSSWLYIHFRIFLYGVVELVLGKDVPRLLGLVRESFNH